MVFAFFAHMIVAWFSRRREFRADEAGADLASKQGMINALQRLQAESGQAQELSGQLTAFGISSVKKQGFMEMFASHPPLAARIEALQNRR